MRVLKTNFIKNAEWKPTEPVKIVIDIGFDIPKDVGIVNRKIRTFSKNDIPAILDNVAIKLQKESKKPAMREMLKNMHPEEYVRWDLSFFGNIHPGVFADMCVLLEKWEEVYGVEYTQPYGIPYRVFPSDDTVKVNYTEF